MKNGVSISEIAAVSLVEIERMQADLDAAREALVDAQHGLTVIAAYDGNPIPTRSKAGELGGRISAVLSKLTEGREE